MTQKYFHFNLGPVQDFVSQARRTRDFWAGSFILSWLVAVAIKATEHQGGKLVDLTPNENFMQWLVGEQTEQSNAPEQGCIPQRFVAEVDEKFKPEQVTQAVKEAWEVLAGYVWSNDLQKLASGDTPAIWSQQVEYFWDINWVINSDKTIPAIDRRKNWRTYTPSKEKGVKCFMMDGWQELSGADKPNRNTMNALLWSKLRSAPLTAIKTDLRKDEALCAIAFIKRRFSRHFSQINYTMSQGWTLKGWPVKSNVPSVTYMAAVPWLKELGDSPNLDKKLVKEFYDLAFSLSGGKETEVLTEIKCLEKLKAQDLLLEGLFSLDGNVFFQTELENPRIFEDTAQAAKTVKALRAMQQSANLKQPSPFYAILLMDGDSMGEKLGSGIAGVSQAITDGLNDFTLKVPELVKEHNGFLVYAGGDDVLAILPLEHAIPCAVALHQFYADCFDPKLEATISAAIEFVHIHTPLTKILKDSHKLLDKVAKDGSGRDALAVRVWKPGGLQIEWSQPWKIVLGENGKAEVCNLAETFEKNNQTTEDFSNKFLYKIRERFDLLNPPKDKADKYTDLSVFTKEDQAAIKLMTMEYMNAYNKKELSYEKAKEVVIRLLKQCQPVKRDKDQLTKPENWLQVGIKDLADSFIEKHQLRKDKSEAADKINKPILKKFKIWEADAALLVRFLAQKGVERA